MAWGLIVGIACVISETGGATTMVDIAGWMVTHHATVFTAETMASLVGYDDAIASATVGVEGMFSQPVFLDLRRNSLASSLPSSRASRSRSRSASPMPCVASTSAGASRGLHIAA